MGLPSKRLRELRDMFDDFDVVILDAWVHKGHYRAHVREPGGREKVFSFSGSPSDYRAYEKRRQDVRRWLAGTYP